MKKSASDNNKTSNLGALCCKTEEIMSYSPALRSHPAIRKFILHRRLIRQVFECRSKILDEARMHIRKARVLTARGTAFDKHRIDKLTSFYQECIDDKRKLEAEVDELSDSFIENLAVLPLILTPEQIAGLIGVSEAWLTNQDPTWRSQPVFNLIFCLMAENDKSTADDMTPLFWFCSRIVSTNLRVSRETMEASSFFKPLFQKKEVLRLV